MKQGQKGVTTVHDRLNVGRPGACLLRLIHRDLYTLTPNYHSGKMDDRALQGGGEVKRKQNRIDRPVCYVVECWQQSACTEGNRSICHTIIALASTRCQTESHQYPNSSKTGLQPSLIVP